MDLPTILSLINSASGLVNQLSVLVPEIEQNYAQAKAALSSDDADAIQAQIVQLHTDTLSLTGQIDALKDHTPTAPPTP